MQIYVSFTYLAPLKYLIAWALPDKKQPFSISYYSKQENNEGLRTTALGWVDTPAAIFNM